MTQESSNLCLPVGWYHESLLEEAEWYEGEEVQEVCISLLLPSYLSMENTILTVACLCLVSESHNLSLRNSARRTLSSRHRQNRKEIPGKDSNKPVRLSIMFLVLNGECDELIDGCTYLRWFGVAHIHFVYPLNSFSMGCAWWQAWRLGFLVSLFLVCNVCTCFGLHDDFFLVSVSVLVWLWCVLGFWVMGCFFFFQLGMNDWCFLFSCLDCVSSIDIITCLCTCFSA